MVDRQWSIPGRGAATPPETQPVATPQSLRRIARLAQKLEEDMKSGGMAYPWKALFRTNAILVRVVAHLAEHLASSAEAGSTREHEPLPRRTVTTPRPFRAAPRRRKPRPLVPFRERSRRFRES